MKIITLTVLLATILHACHFAEKYTGADMPLPSPATDTAFDWAGTYVKVNNSLVNGLFSSPDTLHVYPESKQLHLYFADYRYPQKLTQLGYTGNSTRQPYSAYYTVKSAYTRQLVQDFPSQVNHIQYGLAYYRLHRFERIAPNTFMYEATEVRETITDSTGYSFSPSGTVSAVYQKIPVTAWYAHR